ncbi:MAG: hypothetical protein Ta2B_21930 [Termitinemataceae bacterium]|nr:MAG: hypothetical protein Ta2B_21930 [Termitinemataceae bacterium]
MQNSLLLFENQSENETELVEQKSLAKSKKSKHGKKEAVTETKLPLGNKNLSRRAAECFCSPEELHCGFNILCNDPDARTRNTANAEGIKAYGANKNLQIAAGKIDEFLDANKNSGDFKKFVRDIYKNILINDMDSPIWKLLDYLETKTDFYSAPASTHYHGSHPCGLIEHSLLTLSWCIKLSSVMLKTDPDSFALVTASLFHDLCKVNMYEEKKRNVKDEKTGKWESVPCYKTRENYLAMGHGIESVLRINEFVKLPSAWQYAIRFHMGAYDVSSSDGYSLNNALHKYREVLLLQTADIMASIVEGI